MYDDYGADRYMPMCINLWQNMESVVKYYARMYTFPFFRDGGSAWGIYNINNGIPVNYVIDTAGVVLYGTTGFSESVVRAYIESSLPPVGVADQTARPVRSFTTGTNPVAHPTLIQFELGRPGAASLRIYSSAGKLVRTLFDGKADAGVTNLRWDLRADDGTSVANGRYFYELTAGGTTEHAQVTVLR